MALNLRTGGSKSAGVITKLTSIGEVTYKKTYFHNPQAGERCYLLDRLMGFGCGGRLKEDAVARIYEEAADSSYRKGGINASILGMSVSKEIVMDRLHPLQFPPEEKRKVKTLPSMRMKTMWHCSIWRKRGI